MKISKPFVGLFVEDYGHEQFRMCSKFSPNFPSLEIEIQLFTEQYLDVGLVKEKYLNREITWNKNSYSLLCQCLQGLNSSAFLIFDEHCKRLKFGADLQ